MQQAMRLLELCRLVAQYRPESVLELGGGTTTEVFAGRIRPNGDGQPRVVSMEEAGHWENITRQIVSPDHQSRVTFCRRPRVVESWQGQKVARYDMNYDTYFDLAYVDGPSGLDPDDHTPGHKLPLVDVLCLIRAGLPPRLILVDSKRHSIAFYRDWGIEKRYRMKLRTQFVSGLRRFVPTYLHHTIFERK